MDRGTYRDDDVWVDEYGPGYRCPSCGAPDYHADPSGPRGETVMICESCGFMSGDALRNKEGD